MQYPFEIRKRLSFAVNNIFDERYIESNRHYYQCFPGDPRTFELALQASF